MNRHSSIAAFLMIFLLFASGKAFAPFPALDCLQNNNDESIDTLLSKSNDRTSGILNVLENSRRKILSDIREKNLAEMPWYSRAWKRESFFALNFVTWIIGEVGSEWGVERSKEYFEKASLYPPSFPGEDLLIWLSIFAIIILAKKWLPTIRSEIKTIRLEIKTMPNAKQKYQNIVVGVTVAILIGILAIPPFQSTFKSGDRIAIEPLGYSLFFSPPESNYGQRAQVHVNWGQYLIPIPIVFLLSAAAIYFIHNSYSPDVSPLQVRPESTTAVISPPMPPPADEEDWLMDEDEDEDEDNDKAVAVSPHVNCSQTKPESTAANVSPTLRAPNEPINAVDAAALKLRERRKLYHTHNQPSITTTSAKSSVCHDDQLKIKP